MKNEEKKVFKLEFVKYYPEVAKKYNLTPLETIVYWYIKAVIEFQKDNWNKPVCFTSSKTIGETLNKKPWSIDNAISKLKKLNLIEINNKYMAEYKRNSRYIYLPWEKPQRQRSKVDEIYDKVTFIDDEQAARGVLWDIIYHQNKTPDEIIAFLTDFPEERRWYDWETKWGVILVHDLRELLYSDEFLYDWAKTWREVV